MSTDPTRVLRSGKLITSTSSNITTESSGTNLFPRMENNHVFSDEQVLSGRNSPTNGSDLQQANEDRFIHLQQEMSTLKAMMLKLIAKNQESRQTDTPATTSSFALRLSNMVTEVNRTHRNQRNHFQDDEDDEEYEDTPSNTTESAQLNAIQVLPKKLQKTNTKLFQTHVPTFRRSKN